MLEYLRIRNLALIEDMELEFSPGLNVLTGETGAGKSLILKALNFLTGEKLEADQVRPGQDKAQAEAIFSDADGDTVLRRELSAETGRSRLFLNDALSAQESIRALRAGLLLHVGQHGRQQLLQPSYQAQVLDAFLEEPSLLAERDAALKALRGVVERRCSLEERMQTLAEKRELLEYQQSQIARVAPQRGEEEDLEARRESLRNQERARQSADSALALLCAPDAGILDALAFLARELDALSRAAPDFAQDALDVEEFQHQLSDVDRRLRRRIPKPDDGLDIEAVESRLFELAKLKRKLGRDLEGILDLQQEIEDNLSFLDSCALDLAQAGREEACAVSALQAVLNRLNQARRTAADRLAAALSNELGGLGFPPQARVDVEFTPHEIHPSLFEDRARFLWTPNPGQPAQPLDRIASGGELSRFLLALTGLMARDDNTPTLIFDEVDSGVGGLTLNRVGERLKALAERRQVILITHWPQLAALATRHFHVRKEIFDNATHTFCARLNDEERSQELARMAGGGDQGEMLARQLLAE